SGCFVRMHAPTGADELPSAHSPIRGNCLLEADPRVAEAVRDELRATDGVVRRPRAFDVLACRVRAEAEDGRNLPIRLSQRNEPQALELSAAEMRTSRRCPRSKSTRGAQRMRADQLGAMQPRKRQLAADTNRERAGRARFARNIGRNREAGTQAKSTAAGEDSPVAPLEPDQLAELRPAEAGIGSAAGEM